MEAIMLCRNESSAHIIYRRKFTRMDT